MLLAACTNTNLYGPPADTTTPPPESTSNASPVATAQTVSIKNFAFNPSIVTIKSGVAVTWKNDDSVAHQIVSDPSGETFKSQILNPGESFTFTFSNTGSFNYHCGIHPSMKAQVVVE